MEERSQRQLLAEIEDLQARLEEAEETLRAIQKGEVDALVVTERRGEKVYTLKSADRPYRLMIEGMRQGAVTLTRSGLMLYCNAFFAGLLESPLGSCIGHSLQPFVDAGSRESFEALLAEGSGQAEVDLLASGGFRVPVYLSLTTLPLLDDEDPVLCLVVTDLTQQKRNEQILADNEAKDRFLATLSHELRTPLTPVLATVSSLEANGDLSPRVRSGLAMIRRNIELEARLIDDLLDLTRISRGKLELQRQETDLGPVLRHAIRTCCGEHMAGGHLAVEVDLAEEGEPLWADPSRLTQVFWNLLNNAVKFTPEGGTVRVRSWREESPPAVVVEVSDTGVGIDPELLPRVFDAFEQGEPNSSRQAGLGLGLAISRAIVELHGGEISARSNGRGEGAAFQVRLPAGPAPAALLSRPEVAVPASPSTPGDRGLHILLVEDHRDTADALADLLALCGHRVSTAASVGEALSLARGLASGPRPDSIDLVVSDLGLPDGSGLDLMRELSSGFGLPGIALSGYGMDEDVRKSREAGFRLHITKPVNRKALEDAIRTTAAEAAAQRS